MFMESPRQVECVAESASEGDFLDAEPWKRQHAADFLHAGVDNVLSDRGPELLLEHAAQGADAHSKGAGNHRAVECRIVKSSCDEIQNLVQRGGVNLVCLLRGHFMKHLEEES